MPRVVACAICARPRHIGRGSLEQPICRECRAGLPKKKFRPPPVELLITCVVCRQTVARTGVNRLQRFCSKRCAWRAREEGRAKRQRRWRLRCQACDAEFTSPAAATKYCSADCRPTKPQPMATPLRYGDCPECGNVFIRRGPRKYCSHQCMYQANLRRTVVGRRATVMHITYGSCARCSSTFVRPPHTQKAYCSERCRDATQKRNRHHTQRSTSRKGERITLRALGNRDNWTCHICKRRVTHKPGNTQRSPSIDHLIPLSDPNGTHTWDNVALAHRACNSTRSNTGAAQLRLIA